MRRCLLLLVAAIIAAAPANGVSADRLPIFDTHVHYSEAAWSTYDVAAILKIMEAAGVRRALVSSTPDEGTLRLLDAAPERIVAELRPYRGGINSGNWFRDKGGLAFFEERLAKGTYRGIGEFHLHDMAAAEVPLVAQAARLAATRDVFVHVHSDAGPLRVLFAAAPTLKVLWAHAGMSEGAARVGEMLDAHANLWTEVSFRAHDIAPGGTLDPAWRALLLRHPDRFMIGTDTYTTGRWGDYAALIEGHRRWLAQLPAGVAQAIAYGNAVRLLGAGKGTGLAE